MPGHQSSQPQGPPVRNPPHSRAGAPATQGASATGTCSAGRLGQCALPGLWGGHRAAPAPIVQPLRRVSGHLATTCGAQ
eukprot:2568278-Lingulodinium_polyedra.AAC.1